MSTLSGDIDIPHVGKLPKLAVLGGVAGVIGLIIWQNRKNAQAAAAAATPASSSGITPGDPYPSDGTAGNPADPYSLDPSTGLTYGDEAAAGIGSGYGGYDVGDTGAGGGYGISAVTDAYPWDGTYGDSSDPYSLDPSTGQTYGNEGTTGTSPGVTTGTGPPFSTNAQWSQYVLSYFASSSSLAAITDAIGLYLAGQPVTSAQQGLINDATAIAGPPPVSGASGYPPSINVTGSTSGGTGTSATGSTTTGTPAPAVSGGHVVSVTTAEAVVAWNQTVSQTATVTITGPGPVNGKVSQVTRPQATYGGLESGHNYEVLIQPTVNGKAAGKSGTITFKTK